MFVSNLNVVELHAPYTPVLCVNWTIVNIYFTAVHLQFVCVHVGFLKNRCSVLEDLDHNDMHIDLGLSPSELSGIYF